MLSLYPLYRLTAQQVQLACLGAVEALCRGEHASSANNSEALVRAGSLSLLDNTLLHFGDDAKVASSGIRALVEMLLSSAVAVVPPSQHCYGKNTVARVRARVVEGPTNIDCTGRERGNFECINASLPTEAVSQSSGLLPTLSLRGAAEEALPVAKSVTFPENEGADASTTMPIKPRISSAIGTVLTVMERNTCREVCLVAFDSLLRLLLAVGNSHASLTRWNETDTGALSGGRAGTCGITRDALQWAKIAYGVKRGLKLNSRADSDLASRGGKILAMLTLARGRELAQ